MTQPSGEVYDYESAIANCDAQDAHLKQLRAKAEYALVKIEEAKDAVNTVQGDHIPAANAAQTTADHEAAMNLDQDTQGKSADMTDALRASDCDAMYGSMEVVESGIRAQIGRYDLAIAANADKKANLQRLYADAHDTVQTTGIKPQFLGSPGGGAETLNTGGTHPSGVHPNGDTSMRGPDALDREAARRRATEDATVSAR